MYYLLTGVTSKLLNKAPDVGISTASAKMTSGLPEWLFPLTK